MDFLTIKTARGGKISIHGTATGPVTTNIFEKAPGWVEVTDASLCAKCRSFMRMGISGSAELEAQAYAELNALYETSKVVPYRPKAAPVPTVGVHTFGSPSVKPAEPTPTATPTATATVSMATLEQRELACKGIIQFFTEFNWNPSARFVNTFMHQETFDEAKSYTAGYFTLFDHPNTAQLIDKMRSPEFKKIYTDLHAVKPTRRVNKRLQILFGDPGTGKTTAAMQEYPQAEVMACASDMLPSDLIRSFNFDKVSGKTEFRETPLSRAMVEGKVVILDELGLLPLDTLRTLQCYLDNKDKVTSSTGEELVIKEGFEVIATMNNIVNGQVIALPEPLVDRAYEIMELKSNEKLLAACAFD